MRLKSYFAGTVESAICLAKQEMGEDAMLVHSRRSTVETKHLGAYEVVFAAAQDPIASGAGARKTAQRQPVGESSVPPAVQSLIEEMAEVRRELTRVTEQVFRSGVRRRPGPAHPALVDLEETLAAQQVSGDLAGSILESLESLPATATAAGAALALRSALRDRIKVAADVVAPGVVALVGPPGAGKTTMLAKLAVRCGLASRRPTRLVAYDSHRIAPGEQLRAYAAILGVGFEAVDSIPALERALRYKSRKEVIFLDTPGYSAGDIGLSSELSKFLSTYPLVDTHLVLSCAVKTSDLSSMVERYKTFGPAKLLFTRLDETGSYGAIVSESIRTGLPLSFLGGGPGVPEDLEPASGDRVVDLLLGKRESVSVARA